jgi:hypothetical protein
VQVNQINEHVTHAVIGKGIARDFGISQSAEFFNILSNTLYSDKILAVVREVLCNAWDIHIQTGRTDKPVEVTLADGKLSIRDYGTGISDDDIHPIYAVYGNSTKKLDGQQTGGFGLGSKAPFAYVDHFEVTSFHAGMKTIYAVSKSSAEVAGKPSIMALVSVPCGDETGLLVSMAIQRQDQSRFAEVIRTIARFGEMNVLYNGTPLKTIAFSTAKHGFLMIKDVGGLSGGSGQQIFVRYGNVVYPVMDHDKFEREYSNINDLLQKIASRDYYNTNDRWKIIFQARPDTISVTPSRESLSMTDHTVGNLKELFTNFLALKDSELQKACLDIERQRIEDTWKSGHVGELLTSDNQIPMLISVGGVKQTITLPEIITDIPSLGKAYMSKNYPSFSGFRQADIMMRLDTLEKGGLGGPKNRGKIQSFRKQYNTMGIAQTESHEWFQRTLVQPLMRKLDAVPELSGSKLLVYGKHKDVTVDKNGRRRSWSEHEKRFIEASKLSARPLEEYLPFLRNVVVISFNRIDVEDRLPSFPIMRDQLGKAHDLFVYVVSRADKKIEIVRDFFTQIGMTVVDLTVRQDWEPVHIMEPIAKPVVTKPRKKGLPKLSPLLAKDHRGNDDLKYSLYQTGTALENMERVETPQFIAHFNPRAQSVNLLPGLDRQRVTAVVRLYGDLGGVVVNENQRARFVNELKIPELETWLLAKIKDEIFTNPRIQSALAYDHEKLVDDFVRTNIAGRYEKQKIFRMILSNPDLAIEFGVLNEMTNEDRELLYLAQGFIGGSWHYRHDTTVIEIIKHIRTIKTTPEIEHVGKLVANSTLLNLIDTDVFSGLFQDTPGTTITKTQKAQRSGALDILQYILA